MTDVFHIAPATVRWIWLALPAALLVGALVLVGKSILGARNATFEVSAEGLRLSGDIYGRFIPANEIVADSAGRVDISTGPLKPTRRVGGTAVPGYRSGWFRLANGTKALLYVTDPDKVVQVPTTAGYTVLLSVAETDRFVAQVRALGR
jgi:hypothetical protein